MQSHVKIVRNLFQSLLLNGDLAKFGVYRGFTNKEMLPIAKLMGCKCHAVDSFRGFADPGLFDGTLYPKGRFDVGGSAGLRRDTVEFSDQVVIWEGFVPDILGTMPDDLRFAGVHIDLDHYEPTSDVLRWVWPRMEKGGIVVCHDYFEGSCTLASRAIHEFMVREVVSPLGVIDTSVWFRKDIQ